MMGRIVCYIVGSQIVRGRRLAILKKKDGGDCHAVVIFVLFFKNKSVHRKCVSLAAQQSSCSDPSCEEPAEVKREPQQGILTMSQLDNS